MFAAGLVEEVRRLRAHDRPLSNEASQALGYKEVLVYLAGKMSLEEAIVRIQTRSRNFAKRQITWLNKNKHLIWLDDNFKKNILDAFEDIKT